MEVWTVKALVAGTGNDFIERRAKTGSKDRGDIGGVRLPDGRRVVVEVKNVAKMSLGTWVREAEVERLNDDAAVGLVVHKRVGKARQQMGEQYVTMTLNDLLVLLGGQRLSQLGTEEES